MKKLNFYLLSLALMSFTWMGCSKDDDKPEPETPTVTCPPFVVDVDGNVYPIINIGGRCWMKENLKVTKYNDGTPIANGLSGNDWENASTGAYSVYDDDQANKDKYGLLYNGYAVTTGKLCPTGWVIPDDNEWKKLEFTLGMPSAELNLTGERGYDQFIGGKMKSTSSLWDQPNSGASDSSGFSGLPGGIRNDLGDYFVENQAGYFWSSTVYATDNNYMWFRNLYYQATGVYRNYTLKKEGFSCRCVKL